MADPLFHQLFEKESSTYTYLLADAVTREAVLIDSVRETAERDLQLVRDLGLKLLYVLETHVHADHITGAALLREKTGAKTAVARAAGVEPTDVPLDDGTKLRFGSHTLEVIATPGHTDGCLSFLVGNRVFTGDALLVRGCGRTDFQQGSAPRLYRSITERLFKLSDDTIVHPAHDYKGFTSSTIGAERRLNPRAGGGKSEAEFVAIMTGLKLDPPKRIAEAVPANMRGGRSA